MIRGLKIVFICFNQRKIVNWVSRVLMLTWQSTRFNLRLLHTFYFISNNQKILNGCYYFALSFRHFNILHFVFASPIQTHVADMLYLYCTLYALCAHAMCWWFQYSIFIEYWSIVIIPTIICNIIVL